MERTDRKKKKKTESESCEKVNPPKMDKKATTNEQREDEETCSAQIFVSSPVLHEKEPGLLEKWPILGLGKKCTK